MCTASTERFRKWSRSRSRVGPPFGEEVGEIVDDEGRAVGEQGVVSGAPVDADRHREPPVRAGRDSRHGVFDDDGVLGSDAEARGAEARVTRAVVQALADETWEPRIALDGVRCLAGDDPALVVVDIRYTHVRDGRKDNFFYPLYLE